MERKWWHDKIAYQIYPKSFYDTNGDGIGDVRGIIRKLDYLKELGVDILWLSPIYQSPMADQGYDISDYYAIDPRFGSVRDVEELIAEAKKRGMVILMDLVANHCSDEHIWFRKALEDPDGKYGRFFYIREGKADGGPPANWRSYFGGPAWEELPGHSGKYYLHVFHKKQPDLNWENPEVRQEIYRNINWWLKKGLGGFRIDAIMNIKKPEVIRDYPADRADGYSSLVNMLGDAHGIGEFLTEMREETFSEYDSFTVGEVMNEREEDLPKFIGEEGYFCSIFDFEENHFGRSDKGWYDWKRCLPDDYKKCVIRAQKRVGVNGFLSNILENHDEPRGANRYLADEERSETAKKALACAYFFLRGIPFIYQGQEIGMENRTLHSAEELDDISSRAEYETAIKAGCTKEEALAAVSAYSRDNTRTPMQWSDEPHAGFTSGTPWMKENENYPQINAKASMADPDSLWHFYRKMICLRKEARFRDTFVYGAFDPYLEEEHNLMAYFRRSVRKGSLPDLKADTPELLIAVNMQSEKREMKLPGPVKQLLLDNCSGAEIRDGSVLLGPWQAVVLEMQK